MFRKEERQMHSLQVTDAATGEPAQPTCPHCEADMTLVLAVKALLNRIGRGDRIAGLRLPDFGVRLLALVDKDDALCQAAANRLRGVRRGGREGGAR